MRRSIYFKKKGNAAIEVMLFVVIIFSLALLTQLMYPVFTDMKNSVVDDPDIAQIGKDRINNLHGRYDTIFDNAIAIIFIFVWIGTLISAFFVDTHPVFFVLTIIILLVVFFVGAILGNTYEEIIADGGELEANSSKFSITNFIFGHLLESMIFIGISISITLYAKFRLLT